MNCENCKKLKEQLARMGEAIKKFVHVDDEEKYQGAVLKLENALSSYDPKWIKGKLREAKAEEAWFISSEAENTNPESGMVRCHCGGQRKCPESKFITWLIERAHNLDVKSSQQNQSREKGK